MAETENTATPMTPAEKARQLIFGTKPVAVQVTLNGVPIEFRQPTLQEVFDMQMALREQQELHKGLPEGKVFSGLSYQMAQAFVQFAYVPGTPDKVFTLDDIPAIMALPWNAELIEANAALTKLTSIGSAVESAEGNSGNTQKG